MGFKLSCTALLILLLPAAQLAYGAASATLGIEIRDLRVGLTPNRTRVVFDLSGPASYELTTLNNPARVVVYISGSTTLFDHRDLPLQGTSINQIHSGIQPDASLRYVFDIGKKAHPKLFALAPYQTRGHRLVLDLYFPEESDEKLAGNSEHESEVAMQLAVKSVDEQKPLINTPQSASGEWSGYISLDARLFFNSPAFPKQDEQNASVAFEPEYYLDWSNSRQRFAFSPFFRFDANDNERTHADIRELYWRAEREQLVLKAGVDVVFWGVTESQHLIDIINQTDLVENIDGEEKLGQPMLNLDYITNDWGTWQFYLLPYFRERTFPGKRGRLRTEPFVDTGDALYESDNKENHIDFALRWSHYIGDWDIGLAHFSGTSREPLLTLSKSGRTMGLAPLYLQIDQTSLDVQATKGAWLWKLEAIYNRNKVKDYYAYVGGFEYTRFGVAGTSTDLGLLLEYNYDQRDGRSILALENQLAVLQNDLFAGLRLSGNDIASSRLLAGVTVDLDNQSIFGNIEAVRRLGESWTIAVEARIFSNIDNKDPLYFFKEDDYIELQLSRFF